MRSERHSEADGLGIQLDGVRVCAVGGLTPDTWKSTGIEYSVELRSRASADRLGQLLNIVDTVAKSLAPSAAKPPIVGKPAGEPSVTHPHIGIMRVILVKWIMMLPGGRYV
jgi:hypothetical protein